MIKPEDIYPKETVVRIKRTGEFAVIKDQTYQYMGQNFLHYLAEIEGREGQYCLLHDDIELECLPKKE